MSTGFLFKSVPAIRCVFNALFLIKMLVGAFRLCTVAYTYNLIVFTQNLELDCHAYAPLLNKSLLFSVFFIFDCLIALHAFATNRSRKQIPTSNSDYFESNHKQLFKIFSIISIREKFCRVSVSVYLQFLV